MGVARRFCVRAVVLAMMMSALLSLALPACQFPEYGIASGGAGSGGGADGGMSGGPPADAGTSADGGVGAEGGRDGAGAGGDDTPPLPACAPQSCVAKPADWLGPKAFWEGMAGAPLPPCPRGYTDAEDWHRGLDAPDGPCTCTCTAQGQVCTTPLTLYSDLACSSGGKCATVAVQSTCSALSGCTGSQGSMSADAAPTLSGGTCTATPGKPAPPTWQYNARLCQPIEATCQDSSQVCAPIPASPYLTQRCVTRVIPEGQPLPTCPAAYPNVGKALYQSYHDGRGCSMCSCGSVSGGSCTGTLVMNGELDCDAPLNPFEYPLMTAGCMPFDLGGGNRPTHIIGEYTVVAGKCSVATPSSPTGEATTTGSVTMVCCQ